MSTLILLHPDDNVLVCCRDVRTGEKIAIDGAAVTMTRDVELGHKLARTALRPGDKVVKYGTGIGSMTSAAAPGEWVHMHNMQSDYISAHTREVTGTDR
jgi:hypothetical protein